MTTRYEQLVDNQQSSRYANERLHQAVGNAPGFDGQRVPFLCECADNDCGGRVEATLDQYEEAHFARDDYFILRDHQRVEGEEIIGKHDGYDIVRKEAVSLL
jgi:hypothetical protein